MSHQGFPHVFRGYDPATVDQHLAQLHQAHDAALQDIDAARQEATSSAEELVQARRDHQTLTAELESARQRVAQLEAAAREASQPSFAGLGQRVGAILGLAEEEATEMRDRATRETAELRESADKEASELRAQAGRESDELRASAAEEAKRARAEADGYAADTRSRADLEGVGILEKARARAEAIIDEATREAAARREEAEAYFEQHRATVAQQAADFEAALTQRRELAAAEFGIQLAKNEEHLAGVQARAEQLAGEAMENHAEKTRQAQAVLDQAHAEAGSIVEAAKEQAERIRRESDRELAAATARRDSITAQLSNVRSMLATLGGSAAAGESEAKPSGSDAASAAPGPDHRPQGDQDAEVESAAAPEDEAAGGVAPSTDAVEGALGDDSVDAAPSPDAASDPTRAVRTPDGQDPEQPHTPERERGRKGAHAAAAVDAHS